MKSHVQNLTQQFQAADVSWRPEQRLHQDLPKVLACSDFVANAWLQQPTLYQTLAKDPKLYAPNHRLKYPVLLRKKLATVTHPSLLLKVLRQFRREHMVRIAWRDLVGVCSLQDTMQALSALADAIIDQTLDFLYQDLISLHGTPVDDKGQPQKLWIIALGKLGGGELNFSSDVDLMFAYPSQATVQRSEGLPSLSVDEFFTRLGRALITALSSITEDGFVFRVDMRLRPFGESGPLVMSDLAMENYYQEQGREWERYALIKARIIAGDLKSVPALMSLLQPFVYRRYIDYGVFESLREMKALIDREVRLKGMQDDIKLGKGGIRQIEFIGQAFQLVRGGREPSFQQRQIIKILELLVEKRHLSRKTSQQLVQAYIFLRNTEHRLQMMRDQQTHTLPKTPVDRLRLAVAMGFSDWDVFLEQLDRHRSTVLNLFEVISAGPLGVDSKMGSNGSPELASVWTGNATEAESKEILLSSGFKDPSKAFFEIQSFQQSRAHRQLSVRGQKRLDRLMPLILSQAARANEPELALGRWIQLLEAIGKRSAYLALLVENPGIVEQLGKLCTTSSWIWMQLCHFPVLLDELLDPRQLYHLLTGQELQKELSDRLRWLEGHDLEQQMESLRQFKLANVLRVAIADVMGALPIKRVSDHLTEIAEVILKKSLEIVWHQLNQRHGFLHQPQDVENECEFAIIGYGKLGGIELGYASDLDLVFLHATVDPHSSTRGEGQISDGEFYTRLGQRIFHVLNTVTLSGSLYAVDMRLRPLGESGLLVTSMGAFAEYQRKDAWTWEHQALVRSRVVAGHPKLKRQFESLRREILGRRRDPQQLAEEITTMRKKMREAHPRRKHAGQFDLKVDPGGISDIEFIVQYAVLRWTCDHPILCENTDNLRQLDGLSATGVLTREETQALREAYLAYRTASHHLSLHGEEAQVGEEAFQQHREAVGRVWDRFFTNEEK